MTNEIRFWGKRTKYYEFTNFYPINVLIDNQVWPSTEHYYQATKFHKYPEIIKEIKSTPQPFQVYKLANGKYKNNIREDWNDVKLDTMRTCVDAKFNQNNDLKLLLLSTGNKILIENSPYDSFWGVGGFGNEFILNQNNWLGCVLMETRDQLKLQV